MKDDGSNAAANAAQQDRAPYKEPVEMSEPTCPTCGHGKATFDPLTKRCFALKIVAYTTVRHRCNCACVFPEPAAIKRHEFSRIEGVPISEMVCGKTVYRGRGLPRAVCRQPPEAECHQPEPVPVDVSPCEVCKYHWNLIVMPGDEHSIHCPYHSKYFNLPDPQSELANARSAVIDEAIALAQDIEMQQNAWRHSESEESIEVLLAKEKLAEQFVAALEALKQKEAK